MSPAHQLFQRALELSPSDPLALRYTAIFLFEGRQDQAIPLFERAVAIEPMNAYAWSNLVRAPGTGDNPEYGIAIDGVPLF